MTKTRSSSGLVLPADSPVPGLARAVRDAGGRLLVVGGWIRDRLRGSPVREGDLDLEVYGLSAPECERVLSGYGHVRRIGRSFPILRASGIDADVSLPRRESTRASLDAAEPALDFAEAARRRDLTVNSLGWDPLTQELLDPLGGAGDLEGGVLRACDAERFADDPLRGLRVAHFVSALDMQPDPELLQLCAALDLSSLPGERIFDELSKLLATERPSAGLAFLRDTDLLRFLPELAATVGVPQDPEWHPEGPVWEHTLLVVDAAAALRTGEPDEDRALLWGALCHDLGKPSTTHRGDDGRVRSLGHDVVGAERAAAWLRRLRAPAALVDAASALARHHLAPALFVAQGAKASAYRRLARRLESAGVHFELLERVARADHLGRTTADARARRFPAGDTFLSRARALHVERGAGRAAVLGRHVLARGVPAGPEVGRLVERCRALQDETGWTDAERILDAVMGKR